MATKGLVLLTKDTFSAVSSASFDNVFSNTYKQYKIVANITNTTANGVGIRFRASGTDNSSANYNRQILQASSTSFTTLRLTGETEFVTALGVPTSSEKSSFYLEVLNPFQSTYTTGIALIGVNTSSASIFIRNSAFGMTVTTSYDGFSAVPYDGTITGTITVYGLAQ